MFRSEVVGMLPAIAVLLWLAWTVLAPPVTYTVADAEDIQEQYETAAD